MPNKRSLSDCLIRSGIRPLVADTTREKQETAPRIYTRESPTLQSSIGGETLKILEPTPIHSGTCDTLENSLILSSRHNMGVVYKSQSGPKEYFGQAPTIRSLANTGGTHQAGSGAVKVREYLDETYLERPMMAVEYEAIMGWKQDSTEIGITGDGEEIKISETQRKKMLGNGIIPDEVSEILTCVAPLVTELKSWDSQQSSEISPSSKQKTNINIPMNNPTLSNLALNKSENSPVITNNCEIRPFVKWPGGKRQLLKTIIPLLPKQIKKYCEPFVGGGALLCHFLNQKTVEQILISDANPDLMVAYIVIQKNVKELIDQLMELEIFYKQINDVQTRKKYYENVRTYFNKKRENFNYKLYSSEWVERASQVIFLNRTCFNGLWRVRKSDGGFNTSFGDYDNPTICDTKNLTALNRKLDGIYIVCGDYTVCTQFIDTNTLVYIDPPYVPVSKTANFTAYSQDGWGEDESHRLYMWVNTLLIERQAKILISGGINCKWSGLNFERTKSTVRRNISSNGNTRQGAIEYLYTNY
jgi:DNA adenine methylase